MHALKCQGKRTFRSCQKCFETPGSRIARSSAFRECRHRRPLSRLSQRLVLCLSWSVPALFLLLAFHNPHRSAPPDAFPLPPLPIPTPTIPHYLSNCSNTPIFI